MSPSNKKKIVLSADDAMTYLEQFFGKNPITLAAITSEKKSRIIPRSFNNKHEKMREFIEEHNGKNNLYLTVNSVRNPGNKKPKSTDISELNYFHVDCDPRPQEEWEVGVTFEMERANILSRLQEFEPRPTSIVDSGNGFQAFWKLEMPLNLGAEDGETHHDEAKLYNKALAQQLKGDHCHDVAHLMRLPGTVNVPNDVKLAKGRKRAQASVVEFNDYEYPLSTFKKATSDLAVTRSSENEVECYQPHRIEELEELNQWQVPEHYWGIIADGDKNKKPKKGDNSRSVWLFDVLCTLVRHGVPDNVILYIVTEPEWKISESVLESNNPQENARRQIANAHNKVASGSTTAAYSGSETGIPVLANRKDPSCPAPASERKPTNSSQNTLSLKEAIVDINKRYFGLLSGGKVRFYREDHEDGNLEPMDMQSLNYVLAPHTYFDPNTGAIKKTVGAWVQHPNRRFYPKGFILKPNEKENRDAYNLWKGFDLEPKAGDWSLMKAHILEVLASGDEKLADYITKWTAWSFQHPDIPPRVALVFRGGQGIGKGTFASAIVKIFGRHGMQVTTMNHFLGKFNAHLRHTCLLFADEAVVPKSEAEGQLKGLITESKFTIEAKGIDPVNADNHLHVIMATNNEWAVPASADARRFAVCHVSDIRQGDHEYFANLHEQMKNGGMAAMLYELLHLPLGKWHPEKDRPQNDALLEQMELSMNNVQQVVTNILREGEIPCSFELDCANNNVFVPTGLLAKEMRLSESDKTALGKALCSIAGGYAKRGRKRLGEGRERRQWKGWWLPPLEEARRNWDNLLGFKIDWPTDDGNWAEPDLGGDQHDHF